jgi:hypothetical protein
MDTRKHEHSSNAEPRAENRMLGLNYAKKNDPVKLLVD